MTLAYTYSKAISQQAKFVKCDLTVALFPNFQCWVFCGLTWLHN